MPRLINWELVANPYNWAVIILMTLIFLLGLYLVDPLGVKS